ncbi:MAG TPA: glycosyltransferase family 2 protein [Methanothrix sp.]|nr:glycosyltransferase family 2 protein [Methanothrix sp.]
MKQDVPIENKEFSIVIPVFNSEDTLDELQSRIKSVFSQITDRYELILVDDCSMDNSWDKLKQLHKINDNVKIIHLVRNFGQHNAILCGLNYCSGNYVIIMDDDLQHPPEEIPKLIQKISEDYMVVYGKYEIKRHGILQNILSNIFQEFIHYILKIPKHVYITSFAIFKKETVKNVTSFRSSYVFLPALISKSVSTNKITNVNVQHNERLYGTSNYNIIKYIQYSLNLIINYSSILLKIVGIFGILISVASMIFGMSIIIRKFFEPSYGVMGWNSLMVAITLLGGIILMSVAIIGEYLRRILAEISYDQPYLIGEMEL